MKDREKTRKKENLWYSRRLAICRDENSWVERPGMPGHKDRERIIFKTSVGKPHHKLTFEHKASKAAGGLIMWISGGKAFQTEGTAGSKV